MVSFVSRLLYTAPQHSMSADSMSAPCLRTEGGAIFETKDYMADAASNVTEVAF
jgi:hypothetical protein